MRRRSDVGKAELYALVERLRCIHPQAGIIDGFEPRLRFQVQALIPVPRRVFAGLLIQFNSPDCNIIRTGEMKYPPMAAGTFGGADRRLDLAAFAEGSAVYKEEGRTRKGVIRTGLVLRDVGRSLKQRAKAEGILCLGVVGESPRKERRANGIFAQNDTVRGLGERRSQGRFAGAGQTGHQNKCERHLYVIDHRLDG